MKWLLFSWHTTSERHSFNLSLSSLVLPDWFWSLFASMRNWLKAVELSQFPNHCNLLDTKFESVTTDLQPWLSSSRTPLSLRSGWAFSVLMISWTSFSPSSCSINRTDMSEQKLGTVFSYHQSNHYYTPSHLALCSSTEVISKVDDLPVYLLCCL